MDQPNYPGLRDFKHKNTANHPIMQICFWTPDQMGEEENQTCMNHLAAWWTSSNANVRFSHCELRFATGMVCSILETVPAPDEVRRPGYVHYRERGLHRPGYRYLDFPVSESAHIRMESKAREFAQKGIPFNQAAMRLNFVFPFSWWPIDNKGEAFFCSELIATLLQEGGYLQELKPCTTSPNDLWMAISSIESAVSSFNRDQNAWDTLASLERPPSQRGKFSAKNG
jgi:hypothetical protein